MKKIREKKKMKLCSFKLIEPNGLQSEISVYDKDFNEILAELPDLAKDPKMTLMAKGDVNGVFAKVKHIKRIWFEGKKILFEATKIFVVEETY